MNLFKNKAAATVNDVDTQIKANAKALTERESSIPPLSEQRNDALLEGDLQAVAKIAVQLDAVRAEIAQLKERASLLANAREAAVQRERMEQIALTRKDGEASRKLLLSLKGRYEKDAAALALTLAAMRDADGQMQRAARKLDDAGERFDTSTFPAVWRSVELPALGEGYPLWAQALSAAERDEARAAERRVAAEMQAADAEHRAELQEIRKAQYAGQPSSGHARRWAEGPVARI